MNLKSLTVLSFTERYQNFKISTFFNVQNDKLQSFLYSIFSILNPSQKIKQISVLMFYPNVNVKKLIVYDLS